MMKWSGRMGLRQITPTGSNATRPRLGNASLLSTLLVVVSGCSGAPAVQSTDEATLHEYSGAYEWGGNGVLYVQPWNELTGTTEHVAFDESGDLRVLYPLGGDRFFAGPGAAVSDERESEIEFRRDAEGSIISLVWARAGAEAREARRVRLDEQDKVTFANGDIRLAGTLFKPMRSGSHPAVVLVHGSGPADRNWVLPWARFLVRRGMAVLAYDKRGVGESTGDWNTASFTDLAGDAKSAVEYLKTRSDIEPEQIGLLGVSQAGWVMPLAAVGIPDLAFLISISGPGVPGSETTIDHAQREMVASGMPTPAIESIIGLMRLQYEYTRTGEGWEQYLAARQRIAARLGGSTPENFPDTRDDPYFTFLRPLISYDPAPTLQRLQVPVLALFGELDNNILPEKNRAAWEAALSAGGNRDYILQILPRANHLLLEARVGNNAEMPSLERFVPQYFSTVQDWLATRIRGFEVLPLW